MKVDTEKLREQIKTHAALADSWLDKTYLRLAALPAPMTFLSTVAMAGALMLAGAVIRGFF